MAVSLSEDWHNAFNRIYYLLLLDYHTVCECLTPSLSGGPRPPVQQWSSNPGPRESDNADILASALCTVKRTEHGQSAFLEELSQLQDKQEKTYGTVQQLLSRVSALEAELLELRNKRGAVEDRMVPSNAENRLRISNSLFYGIKAEPNESWKTSEKKIDFWERQVNRALSSVGIEMAHRLGRYLSGKNRPIIIILPRFKDKESIISV